jgi:hypothetical protein
MLFDERGVYGKLAKGHERDEEGLSDDALFKRYQRGDVLWDSDELNVRSELGFTNYDKMPSEAERMRRQLAKTPGDVAYSSLHRHSELSSLLHSDAPVHRWDPLEGIERYWREHKHEKAESGDFESRRQGDTNVPKEGHVRIIVPHMDKGHEMLGLGLAGLTVVQILDPKAYECGWRVGDEVVKVNREPVANELQFKQAVTRAISRNRLTASPLLFDVWREPLRSAHHRQPPGVLPIVGPPQPLPVGVAGGFVPPMLPSHLMLGAPVPSAPMMPAAPVPLMFRPPMPLVSGPPMPGAGPQEHLARLAEENAFLRARLGEGYG